MAKSPYKPYTPNPEQLALFPKVSGNTVNGMGETAMRRATPVYWRDPDTLAHGRLQKWFYTQDPNNPEIQKERAIRQEYLDIELPPVAGEALQQSAEDWSQQLADYAEQLQAAVDAGEPIRDPVLRALQEPPRESSPEDARALLNASLHSRSAPLTVLCNSSISAVSFAESGWGIDDVARLPSLLLSAAICLDLSRIVAAGIRSSLTILVRLVSRSS